MLHGPQSCVGSFDAKMTGLDKWPGRRCLRHQHLAPCSLRRAWGRPDHHGRHQCLYRGGSLRLGRLPAAYRQRVADRGVLLMIASLAVTGRPATLVTGRLGSPYLGETSTRRTAPTSSGKPVASQTPSITVKLDGDFNAALRAYCYEKNGLTGARLTHEQVCHSTAGLILAAP